MHNPRGRGRKQPGVRVNFILPSERVSISQMGRLHQDGTHTKASAVRSGRFRCAATSDSTSVGGWSHSRSEVPGGVLVPLLAQTCEKASNASAGLPCAPVLAQKRATRAVASDAKTSTVHGPHFFCASSNTLRSTM